LLYTLVKPQVLSALHEKIVVLLVAAMNCDLLGASNRAQHQAHFLEAGYLDVLLYLRLLMELRALVLSRYLDEVLGLIEFVAIKLVHPLRVLGEQLVAVEQLLRAELAADAFKLRDELDEGHVAYVLAVLAEALGEDRLPLLDKLAVIEADIGLHEGLRLA